MAKIGYARVSSKEQHLARQLQALNGVDKLFTDKLSGRILSGRPCKSCWLIFAKGILSWSRN